MDDALKNRLWEAFNIFACFLNVDIIVQNLLIDIGIVFQIYNIIINEAIQMRPSAKSDGFKNTFSNFRLGWEDLH